MAAESHVLCLRWRQRRFQWLRRRRCPLSGPRCVVSDGVSATRQVSKRNTKRVLKKIDNRPGLWIAPDVCHWNSRTRRAAAAGKNRAPDLAAPWTTEHNKVLWNYRFWDVLTTLCAIIIGLSCSQNACEASTFMHISFSLSFFVLLLKTKKHGKKNPKTFLQTPDMNRNKARSVSASDQFSHPAVTHGNSIVSVLPPPHPLKGPHHFAYFHRKQLKRGWGGKTQLFHV